MNGQSVIHFGEETTAVLLTNFGVNTPFVVTRVDPIEGDKGDRIFVSNGAKAVSIPRVQGLRFGDMLYLAEDNFIYEWERHFPMESTPVSNNQDKAQAFVMRPVLNIE